EANARILADATDGYLAGAAYAAEAVLALLRTRDADAEKAPLVVVGSSLGALAAPSVVARLRSVADFRVDAAVLIGGGTGVMRTFAESPLTRDRCRLVGMRQDAPNENYYRFVAYDETERKDLLELVTHESRLDPAQTAACLRDIPVLQLYATQDQ